MNNFDIDSLLNLSPVEFEELIKTLLTKMQFKASTTKVSGDGGIDVIATSEQPIVGGKYMIQCKRYAPGNKVGEPAIRELFGAMMHENANKGILITTSDFSQQAKTFSRNKAIELLNGDSILNLLNKHLSNLPSLGNLPNQASRDDSLTEVRDNFRSKFIFSDITVRDNETGLDWVRDANLSVFPVIWSEANEFIATNLNDKLFAGYSDWRLPTIKELETVSRQNNGFPLMRTNEALDEFLNQIGFTNVQAEKYWSSTPSGKTYYCAIDVMKQGYRYSRYFRDKCYLWPVRIGVAHHQIQQNSDNSIIYLPD